ncbi:MAG: LytR C-terminal domain-containing protein [Solirubrobacteraceae bacterium]
MALVLALSLSNLTTKVSIAVSAAALIGVALMALVFFAQGREVKRLSEWAARAGDRAEELAGAIAARSAQQPARAAQAAPRAAQAAGAAAARVAPQTGAAVAKGLMRATSAGTAVAGLAVAGERLLAGNGAAALARAPATAAAASASASTAAAGAAATGSTPPAAAAVSRQNGALAAPPSRVAHAERAIPAALASSSASPPRPSLPPAPARTAASGAPAAVAPALGPPAARRATEDGGAGGSLNGAARASRRRDGSEATIYRRERSPLRVVVLAVLAIAAIAAVLAVVLSSKGGAGSPARGSASHERPAAGAGGSPSSLRVSVLNATETNGLAAGLARTLKSKGYKRATALFGTPSGSYSATVVEYAAGYRAAAGGLAHALGVPSRDVKALPSSTKPLAAGAEVVVIVGQAAAAQGGSEGSAASGEAAPAGEAPTEGEPATEGESAEAQSAEGTEAGLQEAASEPGA